MGRDVYCAVRLGRAHLAGRRLRHRPLHYRVRHGDRLVAGYFGGRIDGTLDLLTNAVLVIPNIPLLILLASFAGTVGPLAIMAIIALTSWPWGAR